jgi:hypothetical protein
VIVWKVAVGKQLKEISFRYKDAERATFSIDGRLLALSLADKVIHVLDLLSGLPVEQFKTPYPLSCLAFSPDGRALAGGGDGDYAILVWDLTGRPSIRGNLRNAAECQARWGSLWDDLGSTEVAQGNRAVWKFVVEGAAAVPFLGKQVRHMDLGDQTHIGVLIRELDAEEFVTRATADRRLRRFLSEEAEEKFQATLRSSASAEVCNRITKILDDLPLARLRVARAVQVLEMIGDERSEEVLRSLATRKGCWSSEDAAQALDRVRWRQGPNRPK